jgi:hypothetical protein
MNKDFITSIEIDKDGRLHLITAKVTFPMIYRTATEVHWNPEKHSLYSPEPRDWTYKMWFEHILNVAEKDCNCKLVITKNTNWVNIPAELKEEIQKREY